MSKFNGINAAVRMLERAQTMEETVIIRQGK